MTTRKTKSIVVDAKKLAGENEALKAKVKELEEKLIELNKQMDKLKDEKTPAEQPDKKPAGSEEIIKDLYNQLNQWRSIASELRSRKQSLEDISERYSSSRKSS